MVAGSFSDVVVSWLLKDSKKGDIGVNRGEYPPKTINKLMVNFGKFNIIFM